MRRGLWFILLLGLGTVLGGMVHATLRREPTDDERKLCWLEAELDLTPDQQAKIKALHVSYCPEICRLGLSCGRNTPEASEQCRKATRELVRAVAAELTADQRKRYLEIVASCLDESVGAASRP
jgi:hypothetical protein